MQITKKLCATQPRLPKDLSISNVVTVRSFGHVPSKTETWELRSRTSVVVEDDVADLKVVKNLARQLQHRTSGTSIAKNLAQQLWHRTSGTSAYSHTYADHNESRNPVSCRDAEVEALKHGSGNSATRRRVAVVIPVSYAGLWEATWEREVGGGGPEGAGAPVRW
jgi:hypothetical protein